MAKPLNREEPYLMTNDTTWQEELKRAYALEDAGDRLRDRCMGPATVAAAAAALAEIDGAPVPLEELEEHASGRGTIHWRASVGHAIYRPATSKQYRDLVRILGHAGYAYSPCGDYSTWAMTHPSGARGRCSVILLKPVTL